MKKLSTLIIISFLISGALLAQSITLKTDQDPMVLKVGETRKLNIVAVDQQGNIIENGIFQYELLRQNGQVPTSGAQIDSLGNVSGQTPCSYNLVALWAGPANRGFATRYINIQVEHLQTSKIELIDFPEDIYSGTSFPLNIKVMDEAGAVIEHPKLTIETSDPSVARLDGLSNFYAETPGIGNLTISSGGISSTIPFKVLKNPVERLVIDTPTTKARTGDVLNFQAMGYDKTGKKADVPILFTVSSKVYEAGAGASAIINEEGKFVAEKPGTYTIIATCGNVSSFCQCRNRTEKC